MKTILSVLFFMALGPSIGMAKIVEGVGSTGGGTSVVCRDFGGKIESAILLDLYEAEKKYNLKLLDSTGSIEGDYVQSVRNTYRLQGVSDIMPIGSEVRENLRKFTKKIQFMTSRLPLLGDVGSFPELPFGCGLEQLAIFTDVEEDNSGGVYEKDIIQVNAEIWKALPAQSKAALVSHELFYKFDRYLAEQTSVGARSIVAMSFSKDAEPVKVGLPASAKSFMTSGRSQDIGGDPRDLKKYSYFWSKSDASGVSMQFQALMGRTLLSKTTVSIPGISFQLANGFNSQNIYRKCFVSDPGQDITVRVPIESMQRTGWELEVQYKTDEQVKLGLYQNGVLLEEAYVELCD